MPQALLPGTEARPPLWLIRLNRHNLSAVLVLGGSPEQRARVAERFHGESPLREGPMLVLDCAREEPRLREALAAWLARDPDPGANPLRAAAHGTLFLDSIAALSLESQRRLLAVIREQAGEGTGPGPMEGVGRLIVGNGEDLSGAVARRRFLPELLDFADKIRVVLHSSTIQEGCARGRGALGRDAGVAEWGHHFAVHRAGTPPGSRHDARD